MCICGWQWVANKLTDGLFFHQCGSVKEGLRGPAGWTDCQPHQVDKWDWPGPGGIQQGQGSLAAHRCMWQQSVALMQEQPASIFIKYSLALNIRLLGFVHVVRKRYLMFYKCKLFDQFNKTKRYWQKMHKKSSSFLLVYTWGNPQPSGSIISCKVISVKYKSKTIK